MIVGLAMIFSVQGHRLRSIVPRLACQCPLVSTTSADTKLGTGLTKPYIEGEFEPEIDTTLTPPGTQYGATLGKVE